MKGQGIERAVGTRLRQGETVNRGRQALDPESSPKCQEHVDTKAFTGRGIRHELRQAHAKLDTVEQDMRALAAASKAVAGAQLYLMLHQRHATGYVFLRWREVSGRKRHLSWDEGATRYQSYAEPLRSWYAQLARQAMEANARHLQVRKACRSLQARARASEMRLYARPVPP